MMMMAEFNSFGLEEQDAVNGPILPGTPFAQVFGARASKENFLTDDSARTGNPGPSAQRPGDARRPTGEQAREGG